MTAIHSNNVLDTSLQSYVDSLDRTACHENRLRSDMRDASIALAHIAQLIKDMGDQQLLINVAMQVDPATRDSVLPAMDDEPSTKPLHPNSLTASACTTAQLIAENGASFSVPFSLVRTHSSRLAKELWAKISAGQKPVVQLDVSETALNRMVQCWQSIRTGRNGFASPLQDYLEQPSFARKLRVNPDQYASLVHQLARRIGNTTWTESKDRPSLLQQIWKLELPQLDAWELRKAGMERLLARQGIFDDPMVYDVQWLDNNIHIEGRLCPDENDESLLSNPV
ncbi:MAG: hypothetical protein KDK78_07875, partial [Chlamydiia bacterium]|nr:hypothetical protein [Chlamydiia bacterium]